MRQRHVAGERDNARATLEGINISLGQDFHTLRPAQVQRLLEEADRAKYRHPRNANGSRARYFHERLQRLAK